MDTPVVKDSVATKRVRRILELASQIKELTAEKTRVMNELSSSIGHDAIIDGHRLTLVVQSRIAYGDAIKVLAPNADLTQWTSRLEYWRLT